MAKVERINGELIRRDREDQGYTRLALLVRIEELEGPTLGESTLRRAEAGKASRWTLRWISQGLGYPPQRYRDETSVAPQDAKTAVIDSDQRIGGRPWNATYDLSGNWEVYYLEDDVGAAPYVCVERLSVAQMGSTVSGLYLPVATKHPHGYVGTDAFRMEGITGENVVFGRYYRENITHLQGAGVFQLIVGRGGAWAEGACTFFGDDGRLMVSLNLWIREGSPQFGLMRKQAEALFAKHRLMWKLPISTGESA